MSLAFKRYGLEIENFHSASLDVSFKAYWPRTKKNYLIVVRDSFSLEASSEKDFKSIVTFAKTNELKLIVIVWEDPDELSAFTEDIRSASSMGFKLIKYEQIDELYKNMLNIE